jgi:hypothetical protein
MLGNAPWSHKFQSCHRLKLTRLGMPELWQFDGKTIQYYLLQDDKYIPVQVSPTFPTLPADVILKYLKERLNVGESQAIREFKAELQQSL